jgi:hypothetical protein
MGTYLHGRTEACQTRTVHPPATVWARGFSPQPSKTSFFDWWNRAATLVDQPLKKGLNSLIILGAWTLWRHHNDCVFNAASPRLSAVMAMAREEAWKWRLAGANGVTLLVNQAVPSEM